MRAKLAILISFAATATAFASANGQVTSASPNFRSVVIRVGKAPGPITVADVNHDGRPDIIVGSMDGGIVTVLLGDGNGQFAPAQGSPFPCNANPNDIAVADMNGDGHPDLVIANTQTPYITVLLGDGKGGFTPAAHSPFATKSFPHPHGVVVGNFTADGRPSVITDSWGHNQILLLESDGKGNLLLPGKFFPANLHTDSGVRAADFNRDGKMDIVTVNQTANVVGLLLGDGHGNFRRAPGSPFPAGDTPWSFDVGDVNGDGNPDVAIIPYERDMRDRKNLGVTVLLGDGKGALSTMRGSPFSLQGCAGPSRVAIGNVAGHRAGELRDVVVSCAQNNKLFFFISAKSGTFTVSTRSMPTGWGGLALGDLTGKSKDDVLVSNNQAGTLTILFPN